MIALELSGVHVGKQIKATYRFPSWPKSRADSVSITPVWSVLHTPTGKVKVKPSEYRDAVWLPFDAEVEII